jgi:hypothetical protein
MKLSRGAVADLTPEQIAANRAAWDAERAARGARRKADVTYAAAVAQWCTAHALDPQEYWARVGVPGYVSGADSAGELARRLRNPETAPKRMGRPHRPMPSIGEVCKAIASQGGIRGAARQLGVPRVTLARWVERHVTPAALAYWADPAHK